jgi:hypothetical protein
MFGVPSFIVALGRLLGWCGLPPCPIQTQHVDTIMGEDPHIVVIVRTFSPKSIG